MSLLVAYNLSTANATGLSPLTEYMFYVRSNCGVNGFSDWVSGSFSTPCLPPTVDSTTAGGSSGGHSTPTPPNNGGHESRPGSSAQV